MGTSTEPPVSPSTECAAASRFLESAEVSAFAPHRWRCVPVRKPPEIRSTLVRRELREIERQMLRLQNRGRFPEARSMSGRKAADGLPQQLRPCSAGKVPGPAGSVHLARFSSGRVEEIPPGI